MILIQNEEYSSGVINNDDLFVCAIGYEERSFYLFNQVVSKLSPKNMLVLVFEDY